MCSDVILWVLGIGYPVGSGHRRVEGIHEQIWGFGGLYCHEG